MSEGGEPTPGASAAVVRALVPDHRGPGQERAITVDQTNRSVVVDETLIVKWYRPPQPVPHRSSEIAAHLSEVGFGDMPPYFGTQVEGGRVVASVAGYLAGATDGWEWYLDEVQAWVAGSHPMERLEERARGLGQLAGRLHVALATASSRWPEPVGVTGVAALHDRARALLTRAHEVTTGITAEHLAPRWDRIGAAIEELAELGDATTPAIVIHGDLHVGNVLDVAGRMFVTDFDGNPIGDDTLEHRSPAVDVASLLQSIDHIGRIVDHRTAGAHRDRLEGFIERSTTLALQAYRAELAGAGLGDLLDRRLLRPLQVAQELHELCYAAAHLPHWVYVPDGALAAMFP